MEPFIVSIPDPEIDDLKLRLARTRWNDEVPGAGWDYGTPVAYLRELCDWWAHTYDWRMAEKRLNAWPAVGHSDRRATHPLPARAAHPSRTPCRSS